MCERGHADKMVLSHDASCYFDALPEETLPVVLPNWHYLHIHNDVIPALKARGVTDEQLKTMLVDNPRRIFEARARTEMTHTSPVPPIPTQFSRLADADPDAPAVTCEGRTMSRGELDASTNRLARAYAELGVGQGDYVTIVMPNSIGWVQAVLAAWKLGAVPQPLSARLPDVELAALLQLRPPALLVGRDDPNGVTRSVAGDFTPEHVVSDAALPEAVSPVWKSMASGGSTGRPKLIEAGGDSRLPAAAGYPLGAQEGDVNLLSVPLSHNTGFTTFAIGLIQGHHLVLMPRFEPARVSPTRHRAPGYVPDDGADDHAAPAPGVPRRARTPTTCPRSVGSGTWPHRARLRSNRHGSTSSAPRWSGNCTAAPNYRR